MPRHADYMVFMLLFNFLEPAMTIIAQTIPIFRVFIARVKGSTQRSRTKTSDVHMYQAQPPGTSELELVSARKSSLGNPTWDDTSGKSRSESSHTVSVNDKAYDGKC
jgi:hypothetical protein